MSLTGHLDTTDSPVRQFLQAHFPNARAILADCRSRLAGVTTLRPAAPFPWTTVGTALDYRTRYYFGVTPPEKLVAWGGTGLPRGATTEELVDMLRMGDPIFEDMAAQSGNPLPPPLALEFFAGLSRVVTEFDPVGRRLDEAQEARLNRYCYVLALFEGMARSGRRTNLPLFAPPRETVEELLAIPSAQAIDDLCALSWGVYTQFEGMFSRPAVLNPTFDGSRDVGGADADLILDGCLIDVKTTVQPQVKPLWLYQLLGYVLLDYSDRYHISEVALYMARQQTTFRWPLDDFMATMAGRAAPPLNVSLNDLRSEFQEIFPKTQEFLPPRAATVPDEHRASERALLSGEKNRRVQNRQAQSPDQKHRQQQLGWARHVIKEWHDMDDPEAMRKRAQDSQPFIDSFNDHLKNDQLSEEDRKAFESLIERLEERKLKPIQPSKRQIKSYERAVRLLQEYDQEKAQR